MTSVNFFGPSEDRDSSPAVALGGTTFGYARVVLVILIFYAWNHVTVIVEANTATPFYGDVGAGLRDNGRLAKRPLALELFTVDCRSNERIQEVLAIAKQRSRGTRATLKLLTPPPPFPERNRKMYPSTWNSIYFNVFPVRIKSFFKPFETETKRKEKLNFWKQPQRRPYIMIKFSPSQNCHSLHAFSQFWEQGKIAGGWIKLK